MAITSIKGASVDGKSARIDGVQPQTNETPRPRQASAPAQIAVPSTGSFDPTYGYDLPHLLDVQAPRPPRDFAAFWTQLHARTTSVPADVTLAEPRRIGNHDVYVARYNGVGGQRLGGYLALPASATPDNAVLYAHGYGGCNVPSAEQLAENAPTSAALFACVRGFGLSATKDTPSNPDQHVVHGIERRETYELGESVSDIWSAANALLEVAPTARQRLYLDGTSFGGGIGAMALAWDERFAKAFLEVPTFGSQALRLTLPTHGSGRAVQGYIARAPNKSRVLETLSYFDAATAARFVNVPTMIAAARSDASVAPPGQFAVYNGLAGDKRLFVLSAGHAPIPAAEEDALEVVRRRWFNFP